MRWLILLALFASCAKGKDDRAKIEDSTRAAKKLNYEAYPQWAAAHPDKACPASITELFQYVGPDVGATDSWGHPYKMMCGADLPPGAPGLAILSLGPDGKEGTADDIKSWAD